MLTSLVDSTNGCQIKRIILKAIVAQEGRETREWQWKVQKRETSMFLPVNRYLKM